MQVFLVFFLGALSGRALDHGLFRPVYLAGVALQLGGVLATSWAGRSYWGLFLAQGVLTGLGSGLMFCPVMALIATYFAQRRVFALAFGLVGSGTGGIVFPVVVKCLLPHVGFAWTVRVLCLVMLAASVPPVLLLRTRLPPRKTGPLLELAAFREAPYALFCVGMFLNFWGLYFAFYYVSLGCAWEGYCARG